MLKRCFKASYYYVKNASQFIHSESEISNLSIKCMQGSRGMDGHK